MQLPILTHLDDLPTVGKDEDLELFTPATQRSLAPSTTSKSQTQILGIRNTRNPESVMSSQLIQPGIYILQNFKSESIMDLSGGDNKSIIGFPRHGLENQQWEIDCLGNGWYIRSIHTGAYLSIEQGLGDGHPIIANQYPVAWVIEPEYGLGDDIYRISWPGTSFHLEMDKGDATPGTKVNLGTHNPESEHQLWRFNLYQVQSQQIITTTETKDDNSTTTTTTVTSTTVTTTTTVTKTPN